MVRALLANYLRRNLLFFNELGYTIVFILLIRIYNNVI